MLREMPISAFHHWADFASREPFGPRGWDLRIGYVLAVLVEALTGERQSVEKLTPHWQPEEQQDWRAMYQVFQDWKHAHHRKDPG